MRGQAVRGTVTALLAVALLLPASSLPVSAKTRQFQVTLHFREADGREESVSVSDFRFVFYDRRFVHHPTGFGEPGELEIRDLDQEIRSLQDEDLAKLKFAKIRKIVFEYQDDGGKRLLHLVVTRTSRHRKKVDWPGYRLRNANSAALPHFRGLVEGTSTDFRLPPVAEKDSKDQKMLTEIDFQVPGAAPNP